MTAIRETMARACRAVGRDPETLEITGWSRLSLPPTARPSADEYLAGSPAEVGAQVRALRDAGLSHLTFFVGAEGDPSPLPALTAGTLERFAPVLEAIRAG